MWILDWHKKSPVARWSWRGEYHANRESADCTVVRGGRLGACPSAAHSARPGAGLLRQRGADVCPRSRTAGVHLRTPLCTDPAARLAPAAVDERRVAEDLLEGVSALHLLVDRGSGGPPLPASPHRPSRCSPCPAGSNVRLCPRGPAALHRRPSHPHRSRERHPQGSVQSRTPSRTYPVGLTDPHHRQARHLHALCSLAARGLGGCISTSVASDEPPAGTAAAPSQFGGHRLPRTAGAQHEEDAGQRRPVGNARPLTFGLGVSVAARVCLQSGCHRFRAVTAHRCGNGSLQTHPGGAVSFHNAADSRDVLIPRFRMPVRRFPRPSYRGCPWAMRGPVRQGDSCGVR